MPKKRASSAPVTPDLCFAKELAGETPPSFGAMKSLYELASDFYSLRPWRVLDESQLIVVRDSASGELCYCSVMGALGEVYSMHAYLGTEAFRTFRKIETDEIPDPGEFLASTHCVYVEFVPKAQLERQDRELLAALGHPQGRGVLSPIFRTIRPGFHPWFVTADEARTLTECIRAVILVCGVVSKRENVTFWARPDTYPMVTRVDDGKPGYGIEPFKAVLPPEPAVAPVALSEATLRNLRGQDYAVRGAMELDYIFTGAPVGKKDERKASMCLALAVDAVTGIVYAPEACDPSVSPGDALAKVFVKAVQANRTVPKEVRVRSERLRESIAPLMDHLGVKLRVLDQLRAADEARAHLLGFLLG